MNKKGQALVEFIIILPIFIMILLAAFDLVNIFSTKMNLDNVIEEVILSKDYQVSDDIKVKKEVKDGYITYILSKDIEMSSPFVTLVIEKYQVSVQRTVYE